MCINLLKPFSRKNGKKLMWPVHIWTSDTRKGRILCSKTSKNTAFSPRPTRTSHQSWLDHVESSEGKRQYQNPSQSVYSYPKAFPLPQARKQSSRSQKLKSNPKYKNLRMAIFDSFPCGQSRLHQFQRCHWIKFFSFSLYLTVIGA